MTDPIIFGRRPSIACVDAKHVPVSKTPSTAGAPTSSSRGARLEETTQVPTSNERQSLESLDSREPDWSTRETQGASKDEYHQSRRRRNINRKRRRQESEHLETREGCTPYNRQILMNLIFVIN